MIAINFKNLTIEDVLIFGFSIISLIENNFKIENHEKLNELIIKKIYDSAGILSLKIFWNSILKIKENPDIIKDFYNIILIHITCNYKITCNNVVTIKSKITNEKVMNFLKINDKRWFSYLNLKIIWELIKKQHGYF